MYMCAFCILFVAKYAQYKIPIITNVSILLFNYYAMKITKIYLNQVIISQSQTVAISFAETLISIFIVVYCLLAMIFVTSLCMYHTNLIIKNQTTKEDLKDTYSGPTKNPYLQ